MCGIIGYIGAHEASSILLKGLRELEYRGYDSAGIAVMEEGRLHRFKAAGRLDQLVAKIGQYQSSGPVVAIGHTRWATHGKPTEMNAHPHGLASSHVVHNGIIENYQNLRSSVSTAFLSQTDSEVIVHLFEKNLTSRGGQADAALPAFRATLDQLDGSYAILLMSEAAPGALFFARKGSPLQLGYASGACHFSSSDVSMIGVCDEVICLSDGQWGVARADGVELFDHEHRCIAPRFTKLPSSVALARKDGFRFYMEKEIYEQPRVVEDVLAGRLRGAEVTFEELEGGWLGSFSSLTLCACGTSYHAALVGSYLFERLARVPTRVEIASEFRYRDPVLDPNGLVLVISQSGETADTLEAVRLVSGQHLATLALCNVDNSSVVREASKTILLRAGIEKGVASTKAFSSQVLTLWLLALYWGQAKGLADDALSRQEIAAMRRVREVLQVQPSVHERLQRLSKRYLHGHGFFFIGRGVFYPLALEGALKLKEISYLHAEGYPAGEMKHGPIALADAQLFTIALMASSCLYDKVRSNVEELSARDSTIVAIATEPCDLADDLIQIRPQQHLMLEFFEMLVVVQLLAMEIAIRLGNDVDMPRNLAKSVTVE